MKRPCEEDDLSQILQFVDHEAECSSTESNHHCNGAARGPILELKNKIFLSHSEAQRSFTEQLCLDLERRYHFPFLDRRLSRSLNGEKYRQIIYQAAQQCQFVILVLSDEYFTGTKWPMLELEAFVQSRKDQRPHIKILPVFFGISRNECLRNPTRRSEWLSVWRNFAQDDSRIDVSKWEDALKVFGSLNGIDYDETVGEVALREKIVSAVCNSIPPEHRRNDLHVQGRTRICKTILHAFQQTQPSRLYEVRVVGVYGVGGIGKTTICKVLCDELFTRFQGKVCHVELGRRSSFDLLKEVLLELTDTDRTTLTWLNEDKAIDLLRRRIRRQTVFLALDNVTEEFIEQAKLYLKAVYKQGSVVMVTARTIDILSRLNIERGDCLEMPELDEEDARKLFLWHAASYVHSISKNDEWRINYCIKQCRFGKGLGTRKHYLPLALKVLGVQLGSLGYNPGLWVDDLSKDRHERFNHFRERAHPIFYILRRGYDALQEDDQLLFMDVALFKPFQQSAFGKTEVYRTYEWLSVVHRSKVNPLKAQLEGLKARSLLEDIGDEISGINMHDLYREFAALEVKTGAIRNRRWVYYVEGHPTDLVKTPPGNCWSNLERILVRFPVINEEIIETFRRVNWTYCSNVVVLHLRMGPGEMLDLGNLRCLRSLDVEWDGKLGGGVRGLGQLKNLVWLQLYNMHYATCYEELGHLTALEVVHLYSNCSENCERKEGHAQRLEAPILDKSIHLRQLVFESKYLVALPDLSKLTSLRTVFFRSCRHVQNISGLSSRLSALEHLRLIDCGSLSQCPGLDELYSLQTLELCYGELSALPNMQKLTNLQTLNIVSTNMTEVPGGLGDLVALEHLSVINCDLIQEWPDIRKLTNLRVLDISTSEISKLPPGLIDLVALQGLNLSNSKLEEFPQVHKLTNLQYLNMWQTGLTQVPDFGDMVALRDLDLSDNKVKALPDMHMLTNLQVLNISHTCIRSQPSLSSLIQLRYLYCTGTELTDLPNLSHLHHLERLNLYGCSEMTSLSNIGSLTTLRSLTVSYCRRLTTLPDLRSWKSLRHLGICYTEVRLLAEEFEALAKSPLQTMFVCDHEDVLFMDLLKVMPLADVVAGLEAKQLDYYGSSLMIDSASVSHSEEDDDGCPCQFFNF